jgi:hypothetical protein
MTPENENFSTPRPVMGGLDPPIHRAKCLRRAKRVRWMAGSGPAMTDENGDKEDQAKNAPLAITLE